MSENLNNLSQRQKERLKSIQDDKGKIDNESKTSINYFLSQNTNPELGFATELALIYAEFCQKRNEYFQNLEDSKNRKSSKTLQELKDDEYW